MDFNKTSDINYYGSAVTGSCTALHAARNTSEQHMGCGRAVLLSAALSAHEQPWRRSNRGRVYGL